jgi:hypothetical protein
VLSVVALRLNLDISQPPDTNNREHGRLPKVELVSLLVSAFFKSPPFVSPDSGRSHDYFHNAGA